MSILLRNTIILAKIESTYGTDPTPSGSANAILVTKAALNPLNGQTVQRNTMDGSMGNKGMLRVGEHVTFDCSVELAGAGSAAVTAGTAPSWGVLCRGAGMDETITATTDTQYAPVSTGHESVTFYVQRDGIQHKITGARGSVTFDLSTQGIPTANFKFIGLYNAPTATANATPDYSGFQKPLAVSEANTPTLTLHSYAAETETISIDYGSVVEYKNLINQEKVIYTDRSVTGSMTYEEPALGTKDFYSIVTGETEGALQLIHGTTTGNIVQFDAAQVQVSGLSQSESSGIQMLQANLSFNKSSGDDEFLLTVK